MVSLPTVDTPGDRDNAIHGDLVQKQRTVTRQQCPLTNQWNLQLLWKEREQGAKLPKQTERDKADFSSSSKIKEDLDQLQNCESAHYIFKNFHVCARKSEKKLKQRN